MGIHKKHCLFKKKKMKKENSLKNADIKGLYHLGNKIRHHNNLLIFGYIRSETNKEAPSAIVKIIENKYLNDTIIWKIDMDNFQKETKTHVEIYEDCAFIICAYRGSDGIQLSISNKYKAPVIGSDIYMEIICDELNIGTKLTTKLKKYTDYIFMTFEKTEFMQQTTITLRIHLEV